MHSDHICHMHEKCYIAFVLKLLIVFKFVDPSYDSILFSQ